VNNKYFSILEEIKKKGGKLDDGHFNDKVLIIDGLNTFIRVFSVMPTLNDDGIHIGGIVGFLKSIGYAIHLFNPTRAIIVFDGKGGSTRRRKLFPEYKAGRKPKSRLVRSYDFVSADDERKNMMKQLQSVIEYLQLLPVTIIAMDNIEADDVIAHIAKQVFDESDIVISSTDKDFLQLINHRIKVYSPTKKKIYDEDALFDEYGIPSKNFLLYRILEGDKSDNIPGVRGAGLTTIKKRFPAITDKDEDYYTLEECIKVSTDKKDELKLYESVTICEEQLMLNRKLMQLFDVDITPSNKMKIMDLVESHITELIKFKFETKFVQDKLFTALPNLQGWLNQNFTQLNRYARMSHGKNS
jgi:DNA polymerase-1